MSWPINDSFSDPLGRWDQYTPWDTTIYYDSSKSWLTTQSHVDIRTFRVINEYIARPQTDLDDTPQSHWESPDTQTDMEEKISNTIAEPWIQSGTGLSTFTIGPVASHGGWPGMTLTTNGSAVATTLTSSIPGDNLNISSMANVILIFPDYDSFDNTSSIQLTSDPDGIFGNGYDSAVVTFASNTSVMPKLQLALSGFAHSGFDNTKVTGVKIVLNKTSAPTSGQTVTLMGLRAVGASWVNSALDFDTRISGLCVPIADAGIPYSGSVAVDFPLIRGDETENDPIPANGAYQVYFFAGGQTSPNDATGSTYNSIEILTRELKDVPDGTGSYITGRLKWNDTATHFECQEVNMTGGPGGTITTTTLHSQTVGGPLSTTTHYVFRVELTGNTMVAKLYQCSFDEVVGTLEWFSAPVSSTDFPYRNGRVGLIGNLVSRDSYILDYQASPTGYAVFQTVPYTSITPVDGVQLQVQYSPDQNLFSNFTGADLSIDTTKTISGQGSYKASMPITSNQFIIDDWTETYFSAAIWLGPAASLTQPQILLNGIYPLRVPTLIPSQWNTFDVDLSMYNELITGTPYTFTIRANPSSPVGLGTFWVDSVIIGRRKISWAARANPNNLWREFRDNINDPKAALHFNINERGNQLQVQATALTDDAYVVCGGGLKIFPHYAELGGFVYDASANV